MGGGEIVDRKGQEADPAPHHSSKKNFKLGVKNKRFKASWDDDYRLKVLRA